MQLAVAAGLAFSLSVCASLVGVRIGRRMRATVTDPERTQLFGMEASLLGLLALLLGFSFAMANARFDSRKQLVIEEANAISTARLETAAYIVFSAPTSAPAAMIEQTTYVTKKNKSSRSAASIT